MNAGGCALGTGYFSSRLHTQITPVPAALLLTFPALGSVVRTPGRSPPRSWPACPAVCDIHHSQLPASALCQTGDLIDTVTYPLLLPFITATPLMDLTPPHLCPGNVLLAGLYGEGLLAASWQRCTQRCTLFLKSAMADWMMECLTCTPCSQRLALRKGSRGGRDAPIRRLYPLEQPSV